MAADTWSRIVAWAVGTVGLAGALAVGTAVPTGLVVAAGATPPATLYAAASGLGTEDCSSAANACDLQQALDTVTAGGTIDLVTAGTAGDAATYYAGTFTIATAGTSDTAPVTIQPAGGVTNPILDGQGAGSVLTVGAGVYVGVNDVTIQDGDSSSGGGIANGDGGNVSVTGITFTDDHASTDGGAIANADTGTGTVTVTGSTFGDDRSDYDGGAIANGDGGGVGTLTVSQSIFSQDSAAVSGGAIANESTSTVTVMGSTFTSNSASYNGGAIGNGEYAGSAQATVTSSTFTDNHSGMGGAIDSGLYGAGTLSVTGSTFTTNRADYDGGAIASGDSTGAGTLQVTTSTFTANRAATDGGAIDQADNGGSGTATVGTSTFSGNSAGYDGGAVANGNAGGTGTTAVTDATFWQNQAAVAGGALDNAGGGGAGHATVRSTTLAGNEAGDGGDAVAGSRGGTVTVAADVFAGGCRQGGPGWSDLGYNTGSDESCLRDGPGDQVGPDLVHQLGTLAGNGGPTQTVTLTAGNPGIGAIPNATSVTVDGTPTTLCPTTDQRGVPSAPGAPCNMGALQLAVPRAPTALTATAQDGQVALQWQAPAADGGSSITGYQVFRGTSAGGEGSEPIATVPATSYLDTTVTLGTTYYYVVRAVNAVGASAASNEVHVLVGIPTITTLTSSANPSPPGPVTFWSGVRSAASGGGVPTGTVRFVVDGTTYGPCQAVPLGPGGGASCTVSFRAGTTHVVSAAYPGSGPYEASTSAKVTQKVTAEPHTAVLAPGQSLAANQRLQAGAYKLIMQGDGNLVEYRGTTALWASGTWGHPGARVVMQQDGNLVEYLGSTAIWASGTWGHPGAHLALQGSDGNVVIYGSGGKALWSTGT